MFSPVLRRPLAVAVASSVLVWACLTLAGPNAATSGGSNGTTAKPAPKPPSTAQWSNAASTDGAACLAALKATGAKFSVTPAMNKPDKNGCGMPQGVTLWKGPTGVVYSPALTIDCSLAAELPKIEKILQEEAVSHLGSEIRKIDTLGSYVCRKTKGPWTTAYGGKNVLSEHSFGLAMDLKGFTPKKGKALAVSKDWDPEGPRREFLTTFRRRMLKETAITHVISPDYNAAHRDHLHVDRGLPFGWWAKD